MVSYFRRNERKLAWLAIAGVAIFAVATNASVQNVAHKFGRFMAAFQKPDVEVTVLPGIPAAVKHVWLKAAAERIPDPRTEIWLTARLRNVGFDDVGEVTARFSAVGEIREIYAYAADGHRLEDSRDGPEISAGGRGRTTVSVRFGRLDADQEHWLFLGLDRPEASGLTAARHAGNPAEDPRLHWRALTVTARQAPWSDEPVETTLYGWAPTVDLFATQAARGSDPG